MRLSDILYREGFGTRRLCLGLVQQGHVQLVQADGQMQRLHDPEAEFEPEGLHLQVQGQPWVCHERVCLMLHKPAGHECSQKPSHWPSIYSLLPAPLRARPQTRGMPGVQAVGRLDEDTTGLLLLTDDGALLHRLTSPRHHVPKVYAVQTQEPFADSVLTALCQGVVLHDDPRPVAAAACERVAADRLNLTLTQGKYHQVKRMLAALGHKVVGLHRWQMGALTLPSDLQPGQWRYLSDEELEMACAKV